MFASHFIDEYYTVHSFGDHVALGAPAAILFLCFSIMSGVKRDFCHGEFILASLIQLTLIREHFGIGCNHGEDAGDSFNEPSPQLCCPRSGNCHFSIHERRYNSIVLNQLDFYHRKPYFTEQTVHTITFKIYTSNGDCRELCVNEVNKNGFSWPREPEDFLFFGWKQRNGSPADYWRHFSGLPLDMEVLLLLILPGANVRLLPLHLL